MAHAHAPLELLPDPRPLIGNERSAGTSGGEHTHVYAATGRPTASVPLGGEAEMDAAVAAATAAGPRWRALAGAERRNLLMRASARVLADAERLTRLQTLESGMPVQFARTIPAAAADFIAYYAGWAD